MTLLSPGDNPDLLEILRSLLQKLNGCTGTGEVALHGQVVSGIILIPIDRGAWHLHFVLQLMSCTVDYHIYYGSD